MVWLLVHLVATAVLTGVAWVSLAVVYPAFALVGSAEWPSYHAAHVRAITRVVVVPWAAQGVSTAALLLDPPHGEFAAAAGLAGLALLAVVLTFAGAVPAHNRLGTASTASTADARALTTLNRVHLVRSLVWTAETVLAALLLVR
jgi:hypothetical protein